MAKHMFPGANTPDGFFSYFDQILPYCAAKRTIYLKGTSGSGKSTLMKKIGAAFETKGNKVEYLHCSNDADSLDGICVRDLGVSIIDGTAPHVNDPVIPLAIDEIFNLADFIEAEPAITHKAELLALNLAKKQLIDKAYHYFHAAYDIHLNNTYINEQALEQAKLNTEIVKWLAIFNDLPPKKAAGQDRKLFASAVTPDGPVNFIDRIIGGCTVNVLYAEHGMGADRMLSEIRRAANLRGLDTESFCCPLHPSQPEHLLIPDLNLSFTTANQYHTRSLKSAKEIYFSDFLDHKQLSDHKDEIEYNNGMFNELLQKTIAMLQAAKIHHDQIENIYLQGVNFKQLDEACAKMLSRLESITS